MGKLIRQIVPLLGPPFRSFSRSIIQYLSFPVGRAFDRPNDFLPPLEFLWLALGMVSIARKISRFPIPPQILHWQPGSKSREKGCREDPRQNYSGAGHFVRAPERQGVPGAFHSLFYPTY